MNGEPAAPAAVVLVADDEPDVRALVVELLADQGFRTLEAGDGEAAVALAEAERPDLIVMDVMMPGMDGYTALTHLASGSTTRDIPVVILTGETGPVLAHRSRSRP